MARFRDVCRSLPGRGSLRLPMLLLAPAGIGLGHVLGYTLAGAHTQPHLAATGHGYLPHGLRVAFALALLGALTAVLSGVRRARRSSEGGPGVCATAGGLALVQAGGFVLLEVLERLAAGASLADLTGPVFVVGLVVQLVVGAVLAPLLVGLRRAGERLGSRSAVRLPRPVRVRGRARRVCGRVGVGRSWSERAPPVPLPA